MNKFYRLLRHDLPAHFVLLFLNWLPDNVPFLALRGACLHPFLGGCGKRLRLGRNVSFYNPSQVFLGNDVYVAYGCWFMAGESIRVGNEVIFGPYCVIASSEHTLNQSSFRHGPLKREPIVIGDGCWIAARAIVTAGVTLGRGCLAAAGAVVVDSFADGDVIGGIPAKRIKNHSLAK